jgi:hypothetical protein
MKHKNKKRHNIRYKKNDRKRDSKKGKMDIKKNGQRQKAQLIFITLVYLYAMSTHEQKSNTLNKTDEKQRTKKTTKRKTNNFKRCD